jgi:hypothetical protein
MGIENHRICAGYDLNGTVLPGLRLDLVCERREIVHEPTRSLGAEERQLLLLQDAIEIHVESSLHLPLYVWSACWTLIQFDEEGSNFIPGVMLLQYFMSIRFENIACHTIEDGNSSSIGCTHGACFG